MEQIITFIQLFIKTASLYGTRKFITELTTARHSILPWAT